jgi:hypothetical protein
LLAVEPDQEHLDRRLGQARTTNTHNTAATAAVASNSKCPPHAENQQPEQTRLRGQSGIVTTT